MLRAPLRRPSCGRCIDLRLQVRTKLRALVILTMLMVLHSGCTPAVLSHVSSDDIDWPQRFLVRGESDRRSFDRHSLVVRRGRQMDAMVLVAPVTIAASLTGVSGGQLLECLATPVFNTGDGIQMDIYLKTGAGEKKVYSRYFDAGRIASDRDWVPLSVPLDLGREASAELSIRVSGGPQGDLVGDWLALSSFRLTPGP